MERKFARLKMNWRGVLVASALSLSLPATAFAQTGVDDDRISLPEGPGSLEGVGENVEVDPNMGLMRWNIPIQVPQGYGGMTPELALNYASGNGGGPFGIGWALETPTIERMTSRGTPLYVTDDIFAHGGGEELVEVSDADGNKVYRERFEKKFYRYTWHDVGDGKEGYWTTEYPDGRIGYFGADAQGNLVDSARTSHPDGGTYRYHLVEVVDPYDHKLRYEYDKFGGNKTLLTDIKYVYLDDSPQYSVQFDYELRQDLLSDAGAGFEELLEYRVTGIRVLFKEQIVREYALNYEDYTSSGGFSRLTDVQTYGLGGKDSGDDPYPIRFKFGYSKALGVSCTDAMDADCGANKPYLRSIPGGVGLGSGKATFVDINGDALPDLVDTTGGSHNFYINQLEPDGAGGWTQTFSAPQATAINTSLELGGAGSDVQVLDINGDGYVDLVDTNTGNFLLNDPEAADWQPPGSGLDVTGIKDVSFPDARFQDYNGDKKIDLVVSTSTQLQVHENTGNGFVTRTLTSINAPFSSERIQLSDMNGDGLNDVVEIQDSGSVRYRLNLGLGRYTDWEPITGLNIDIGDRPNLDLEDLNGDGISDVVIVGQAQIKYMINRNGNTFDPPVTMTSADIDGDLPARDMSTRVLFADMNANGSEDVVWITASGETTYLELFPARPNLISSIDNGIGFVQQITYGTSAEHAARAKAAGAPWDITLPNAMPVVDKVDIFVTLTGDADGTGLHEIMEYTYRNGFYDGLEKQFRGFADVIADLKGDDTQEDGRTIYEFNVGQLDPWYNGLLERQIQESGGDILTEVSNEYEDCDVAEAPAPAMPLDPRVREQVRHVCNNATQTIIKERQTSSANWITTRKEMEYDGYGNVTLERDLGDIAVQGDELHTETEYATSPRWILNLPSRTLLYNDASKRDEEREETQYFYDGADFEGLALGMADRGFLSRTSKLEALPDTFIHGARNKSDAHGNIVEIIEPNGSPEEMDAHRRQYTYEPMGLYTVASELRTKDASGTPYQLRREARYDYAFGNTIEATSWMVSKDGTPQTARRSTVVSYDRFGRAVSIAEPGDDLDKPTQTFVYELQAPASRVAFRSRKETNGPINEESFRCFDGKGRLFQTRTKLASGEYLVTGFNVFNARGTAVKTYQPYTSSSADCETSPPADVLFSSVKLDASFRPIETTMPDESLYGQASVQRTVYLPLRTESFDEEDTDTMSPHANTPTVRRLDGLGRVVGIDRTYKDEAGSQQIASYEFFYDNTNSLAGYTDPAGNRHTQARDLMGRVLEINNPNAGTTEYAYDASGNILSMKDARGKTMRFAYDGVNRVFEIWDGDDRDNTLATTYYDIDADCPITECTNSAANPTRVVYTARLGDQITTKVTERMGYDVRSRKIFEGRSFEGLVDLSVTMAYDNRDRLIKKTLSDGTVVETTYDDAGRETSMPGYVSGISYDERGLLEQVAFANGARMDVTHDALQRYDSLASLDGAGAPIEGWDYTRDRVGNILNVVDLGSREGRPSTAADFVYDDWYRTTTAQVSVGTANEEILSYVFDDIDNILSVTSSLGEASGGHVGDYTYGAQPNAATKAGTMEMAYDAGGYMVERADASMTWDYQGRLVTVETEAGKTSHYAYSFNENRVAKMEDASLTLYGPGGFEVRDGVGVTYVRKGRQRVARHETPQFGASFYPDADSDGDISAGDAFAAQLDAGMIPAESILAASAARLLSEQEDAKAFLHSDHLGSVTAATDEGGEVRGQRAYFPYGDRRWEEGYVDEYGFTGQERDRATGLLHFQYRYYDARIGRWASFDPKFAIVSSETMESYAQMNGYAYVENNPFNSIDPLGLTGKKKKSSGGKKSSKKSSSKKNKGGDGDKSGGRKRANAVSEGSSSKSKGDGGGDSSKGGLGDSGAKGLGTAEKGSSVAGKATGEGDKSGDKASAAAPAEQSKADKKLDLEIAQLENSEKDRKAEKFKSTASLVNGIASSVLGLANSITFSVLNITMNQQQAQLNQTLTEERITAIQRENSEAEAADGGK